MATIKRKAQAQWTGSGKEGRGALTTASGTLSNTPYSFSTRFENGTGTNPAILIMSGNSWDSPGERTVIHTMGDSRTADRGAQGALWDPA